MTTTPARPTRAHPGVAGEANGWTVPDTGLTRHERDRLTDALVEDLRTCRDEDEARRLRQDLATLNLPVARLLARRYRDRGESEDDLEQVASLALTEAAQRFDPDAATSFYVFCVPTVLGGLRRHFRDRGWTVRPPRSLQELQSVAERAQSDLEIELRRRPTVTEVARRLDRDPGVVTQALGLRSCYSPERLDRPSGSTPDSPTVGERLADPSGDEAAMEARLLLRESVAQLAERDRRIVRLRFFEGLTQREIAEHVGVTQMQVSRILTRIYATLRQAVGPL